MRGSDRSKSSMRLRANLTALKLLDDIGVVFVVVVVVVGSKYDSRVKIL